MDRVICLISGPGLTAGKIYPAMDFIHEEEIAPDVIAVIQDDYGRRHYLSSYNYEKVEVEE